MNVGSTSVILPTCFAGRFLGWMLPARGWIGKSPSRKEIPLAQIGLPALFSQQTCLTFVTRVGLRVYPPAGRHGIRLATNGSTNGKPNTSHEVTAARAGRPSGRTCL